MLFQNFFRQSRTSFELYLGIRFPGSCIIFAVQSIIFNDLPNEFIELHWSMKFLNFHELDIIKAAFCQKVLEHFSIAENYPGIEKMSILILGLNFITMIDFTLTVKKPTFLQIQTYL